MANNAASGVHYTLSMMINLPKTK